MNSSSPVSIVETVMAILPRNVVQCSKELSVLESFWLVAAGLLVGPESGLRLLKCFGPAYKIYLQRRTPFIASYC